VSKGGVNLRAQRIRMMSPGARVSVPESFNSVALGRIGRLFDHQRQSFN